MVGVEFKTGMSDQGVPAFTDISFGVSGAEIVNTLNAMRVNCMVMPVPENGYAVASNQVGIVTFVQKIQDAGGGHINIVLSRRKWSLHVPKNQASWAHDIGMSFNALAAAGLTNQVTGFRFDENSPLHGDPSTEALWNARHTGVLGALDILAANIGLSAAQSRYVFIHGKGYGSQFKGVKASSDNLNFPTAMGARCADYAYSYKWDAGGGADQWIRPRKLGRSFQGYRRSNRSARIGARVGLCRGCRDGIRAGYLDNMDIGGKGPKMRGAWNVFQQYGWGSTFFGPFLRPPEYPGATILHLTTTNLTSGVTNLSVNAAIMDTWEQWHSVFVDADNDGMLDFWEVQYFGSTTNSSGGPLEDWDNDGMADLSEFLAGTNPTNILSLLAITDLSFNASNEVIISWYGISGKYYTVRATTNLLEGFSDIVISNVSGIEPINVYTDTVPTSASGFYQVEVE